VRRTKVPKRGGLNGNLGILIGLLAFSTADSKVDSVLKYSIRAPTSGRWRCHNRDREEGCKKFSNLFIPITKIFPNLLPEGYTNSRTYHFS
jgi:hypothetical protein